VSTGSPILDLLNDLLRGCGVEDRKIELFGILRDIAREMAGGASPKRIEARERHLLPGEREEEDNRQEEGQERGGEEGRAILA